jgi:hypothetical protein
MKKVAWERTYFDRCPGAEEPQKKMKGNSVIKNSTEKTRNFEKNYKRYEWYPYYNNYQDVQNEAYTALYRETIGSWKRE